MSGDSLVQLKHEAETPRPKADEAAPSAAVQGALHEQVGGVAAETRMNLDAWMRIDGAHVEVLP